MPNLLRHGSDEIGIGCLLQPMQGNTCPSLDVVVMPCQGHQLRVVM